jgi:hypothetical protein
MSAAVEFSRKAWTEAELQSLPDEGYIYELVDGELVMSPKNNFEHEQICARLLTALENFNSIRLIDSELFWVPVSDVGCITLETAVDRG